MPPPSRFLPQCTPKIRFILRSFLIFIHVWPLGCGPFPAPEAVRFGSHPEKLPATPQALKKGGAFPFVVELPHHEGKELATRGIQNRLADPATGCGNPASGGTGRGRWPLSGSRPRRANRSRSTSVKRSSRSPVSPSRFI